MAKEDSIFRPCLVVHPFSPYNRIVPIDQESRAQEESEPALKVVTVYQDPLTRHWAMELFDRLGRLIDSDGICRKFWSLNDLAQADDFADAVEAAAEAHVLVISVRDAGQLPRCFHDWIDAWLPNRTGPVGGALVALIGVPLRPNSQSGRAYACLESVAKRAGLDFLPTERKLPQKGFALPAFPEVRSAANVKLRCFGVATGQGKRARLRRGTAFRLCQRKPQDYHLRHNENTTYCPFHCCPKVARYGTATSDIIFRLN